MLATARMASVVSSTPPARRRLIFVVIIQIIVEVVFEALFALPGTILHHGWLRVANLVVAPLLAGWLATVIAHWLIDKRHKDASPKIQFWRAWWFTLGFSLLRFAYTQRG